MKKLPVYDKLFKIIHFVANLKVTCLKIKNNSYFKSSRKNISEITVVKSKKPLDFIMIPKETVVYMSSAISVGSFFMCLPYRWNFLRNRIEHSTKFTLRAWKFLTLINLTLRGLFPFTIFYNILTNNVSSSGKILSAFLFSYSYLTFIIHYSALIFRMELPEFWNRLIQFNETLGHKFDIPKPPLNVERSVQFGYYLLIGAASTCAIMPFAVVVLLESFEELFRWTRFDFIEGNFVIGFVIMLATVEDWFYAFCFLIVGYLHISTTVFWLKHLKGKANLDCIQKYYRAIQLMHQSAEEISTYALPVGALCGIVITVSTLYCVVGFIKAIQSFLENFLFIFTMVVLFSLVMMVGKIGSTGISNIENSASAFRNYFNTMQQYSIDTKVFLRSCKPLSFKILGLIRISRHTFIFAVCIFSMEILINLCIITF